MAGYHVDNIQRGEYGEISKIVEEVAELKDAAKQGIKVMVLVELADILGAIDGYLNKHYRNVVKMSDLLDMSDVTKRAFETGHRK